MDFREPKIAEMLKIASISVCLLLLACNPKQDAKKLPYYLDASLLPYWELPESKDHHLGNFEVYDQQNQSLTQAQLQGKITLVNFFFTGCGSICPKMTKILKGVADSFRFEPNLQLYSFTVTPWIDSLPKLEKFGERYQINPNQWHLVNGPKEEVYPLARKSFFAEEEPGLDKSTQEFLHTELVLLVDQNLRLRGVYNGTQQLEAEKMMADIWVLLKKVD